MLYLIFTIRVRNIVLRTQIILANTAGTPTILFRTGIGLGMVVMAIIMIVVCSVPCFMAMITFTKVVASMFSSNDYTI